MNILEVVGLTKCFGGLIAVNKLSFNVIDGEILGLIGPNGAGKTTVFNLISGFLKSDAGIVKLKGENILGLSPHDISHKGITRTFQLVKPFNKMTLSENVIVGLLGKAEAKTWKMFRNVTPDQEKEVDELLNLVGLLSRKDERAQGLPLALKKKLEFARALASNPTLMLLDEPTSGLNPVEVADQMNVIKKIRESGITVVVVEHMMKVIMGISHRIVVLDHGEKIAEGKPKEIAKNERVIKAYLGGESIA